LHAPLRSVPTCSPRAGRRDVCRRQRHVDG